jgi:hypothetical protein
MSPAVELLGLPLDEVCLRHPDLVIVPRGDGPADSGARTSAVEPSGGYELLFDDADRVDTVFVHRNGTILEGEDFSFRTLRKALRRQFGEPESSGEEGVFDYLGPQGAWDRYFFPTHAVHFQFQYGSSALELITYMTLEQARRVTDA